MCTIASAGFVIFTSAADLIWLAADSHGTAAIPALTFRTAFYLYCWLTCVQQAKKLEHHLDSLRQALLGASVNPAEPDQDSWRDELARKVRRYKAHLYSHQ